MRSFDRVDARGAQPRARPTTPATCCCAPSQPPWRTCARERVAWPRGARGRRDGRRRAGLRIARPSERSHALERSRRGAGRLPAGDRAPGRQRRRPGAARAARRAARGAAAPVVLPAPPAHARPGSRPPGCSSGWRRPRRLRLAPPLGYLDFIALAAARARRPDRLGRRPEGGLPGRRALRDAARQHRVGGDGRRRLERARRPRRDAALAALERPRRRASAPGSTATGTPPSASCDAALAHALGRRRDEPTPRAAWRRRPRLLGPEPRAQLRRAARLRAAPGAATPTPSARERWAAVASRARASPASSTTCSPTPSSTPSCSPRPCRRTPRSPSACSRPASTASSRSRWRSRSPTPSGWSRPRDEPSRMLMVGHLLEYHPGVAKLKEIVDAGELGDIHYIYSQPAEPRQAARRRERALVASARTTSRCVLHLAGEEPTSARRAASATCAPGVEDVVFCYLRFPSGLAAHLHLSWLDPHKERRFTVVGSRRMATFDDMDARAQGHRLRQGLRRGLALLRRVHHALGRHLVSPRIPNGEPLRHRVRALRRVRARRRATPRSDGDSGLRVVRVLEALQRARRVAAEELACCARLTGRPGCCSATASSCRTTSEIGAHVVIHAGTVIGDGCEIQDGAVLGKPPVLGAPLAAPRASEPPPLVLGRRRGVCAGAVVFAGARIGAGAIVGDQALRPRARVDRRGHASSGAGIGVDNDVTIGARVRIQTERYVTAFSRWSRTTCSSARA